MDHDTKGALTFCRGMHELDKAEFSLKNVQCEVVEGSSSVSLAEKPAPFAAARELMAPYLAAGTGARQGREQVDYEIHANWKLVWENNRECFHCNINHPQYIKANWDHYNADDTPK